MAFNNPQRYAWKLHAWRGENIKTRGGEGEEGRGERLEKRRRHVIAYRRGGSGRNWIGRVPEKRQMRSDVT